MHRLDLGLYSHAKEFWGNGVRTHVNSKERNPSNGKFPPEEDQTHNTASRRTAGPTHYQRAIPPTRMWYTVETCGSDDPHTHFIQPGD